ncbi:hypothetical protein Fcan01_14382 [Folsomia candida]|uniref:Uncharacterized protein n=1 Tax=Folsomia candida TaxID=158441 RepID=A0A226E3A1_FOLCA|nr:hypothetical protein Fcan01_14382 [Folsomia candida]
MFDAQPRVMSERKINHLIFFLLALMFAILESGAAFIVCGGRWLRWRWLAMVAIDLKIFRCGDFTRQDASMLPNFAFYPRSVSNLLNPKMFTGFYTQYFLLYSAVSGISELAFFCAMGATLMIGIAINFLTLRLYAKLPLVLHLTTTVFALVIPILVNLTLPPVVMTHEETRKLLKMRYLRYRPYRKQSPVLFRVICAMRPLTFHAGLFDHRFFKLQRSTLFTYYKVYVDYTIVALFYIPV